jgi:hypothetical protein
MTVASRRAEAAAFAEQMHLDPDQLFVAAEACWAQLNPQSKPFTSAVSMAAVALRAVDDLARGASPWLPASEVTP